MKKNMKTKNRSQRYDINTPKSRREHRYSDIKSVSV